MDLGSQEIKCNVESCKYNDHAKSCTLDNIMVAHNNDSTAHTKAQTECASFELQ